MLPASKTDDHWLSMNFTEPPTWQQDRNGSHPRQGGVYAYPAGGVASDALFDELRRRP